MVSSNPILAEFDDLKVKLTNLPPSSEKDAALKDLASSRSHASAAINVNPS